MTRAAPYTFRTLIEEGLESALRQAGAAPRDDLDTIAGVVEEEARQALGAEQIDFLVAQREAFDIKFGRGAARNAVDLTGTIMVGALGTNEIDKTEAALELLTESAAALEKWRALQPAAAAEVTVMEMAHLLAMVGSEATMRRGLDGELGGGDFISAAAIPLPFDEEEDGGGPEEFPKCLRCEGMIPPFHGAVPARWHQHTLPIALQEAAEADGAVVCKQCDFALSAARRPPSPWAMLVRNLMEADAAARDAEPTNTEPPAEPEHG